MANLQLLNYLFLFVIHSPAMSIERTWYHDDVMMSSLVYKAGRWSDLITSQIHRTSYSNHAVFNCALSDAGPGNGWRWKPWMAVQREI